MTPEESTTSSASSTPRSEKCRKFPAEIRSVGREAEESRGETAYFTNPSDMALILCGEFHCKSPRGAGDVWTVWRALIYLCLALP